MIDYTQFQEIFPSGVQMPYDRKLQHEIEAHRKTLEGHLFIDRVLQALGVTKGKLYPPKNDNGVRQLHQQICEATVSMHHKLAVLYYILLDFDLVNDRASIAESFIVASSIPKNYQIFMKGLWHMDKGDLATALEYITHPSLIPDFADDIIIALVQQAVANDYSLALSYFYSVQPVIKSSRAMELLFRAMAHTDISEALLFSRTQPDHTRELLFQQLVTVALENRSDVDGQPNQSSELAFLPFDTMEERWFDEYLSTGEGRSLKKAKDTILIRKIACDRFDEVRTHKASGQLGAVLEGIKSGTEGHGE